MTEQQNRFSSNIDIHLTESALKRVAELIAAQNRSDLKLRVYITGGGCSGFQYGFKLDENQEADDIAIQKILDSNTITVLIDPLSFQYLMNAKIDFVRDLQGSRFMVSNPSAETTCSCGSSFALKETEEV